MTLVAADATVFGDNRVDLDKGNWLAGASFTAHRGNWTGFAQYQGQFAGGWTDNRATLGFRMAF